jgi:hypothetical protein
VDGEELASSRASVEALGGAVLAGLSVRTEPSGGVCAWDVSVAAFAWVGPAAWPRELMAASPASPGSAGTAGASAVLDPGESIAPPLPIVAGASSLDASTSSGVELDGDTALAAAAAGVPASLAAFELAWRCLGAVPVEPPTALPAVSLC